MGTSEYLVVDITETLGDITELSGATFDIWDSQYIRQVESASGDVIVDGMRVKCLIQPTEDWAAGMIMSFILHLLDYLQLRFQSSARFVSLWKDIKA